MIRLTDHPTAHLNPEQRKAAEAGDGPHLVLAGPGTGKTTTLVARFAQLLDRGVPAERIFCATFTRKAAAEMVARLGGRLPPRSTLWIGTFHKLCLQLLRDQPRRFGLTPGFQPFAPPEQRQLLARLRIWWDADDGGDLVDIISNAKDRLVGPEAYLAETQARARSGAIRDDHWAFLAAAHYRTYQDALAAENAIDYGDMIRLLVEAMRADPGLAAELAGRFDHLLVDEYQDVNPAQVALLDQLLGSHDNIWAVGDDDQTLYGFRSADVRYLLDFEQRHPGTRKHVLVRNYRSTRRVVAAATLLIDHNAARHAKELTAASGEEGPPVICHEAPDEIGEARWIAEAVGALLKNGRPPAEIAVLYRNNFVGADLQLALADRDIPYRLARSQGFWTERAARQVLAILRLIADPDHPDRHEVLGHGARARAHRDLAADLRARRADFTTSARRAADAVGGADRGNREHGDQDDWQRTAEVAGRRARRAGSLRSLEEEVERARRAQTDGHGAVTLSTVHSAKGLEWDTVFIAGFGDGLMPYQIKGRTERPDEERRIAYVAMTRARKLLTLVWATRRGRQAEGPSPYVREALAAADPTAVDWRPTERPAPWARPAEPDPAAPAAAPAAPAPRPRNEATPWQEDEVDDARLAYAQDGDIDTLAQRLGRSREAIVRKLASEYGVEVPADGCADGQLARILTEQSCGPKLIRERTGALLSAAAAQGVNPDRLVQPLEAGPLAGLSPAAWAARRVPVAEILPVLASGPAAAE